MHRPSVHEENVLHKMLVWPQYSFYYAVENPIEFALLIKL